MKRLLVGILLISLLVATAHAAQERAGQGQGNPQKRERAAKMRQELGLSEAQLAQMKKIRENGGGREEIRAVLTDEQRAKVDEFQAQAKSRRANKQNNPDAAPDEDRVPADSDNG